MAQPAGVNGKADAATRKVMTASRRSQRRRERPKTLIVSIVIVLTIVCLAALSRQLISLFPSLNPSTTSSQQTDHAGKIVVRDDLSHCKQMNLDNDSGRITDDPSPCDEQVSSDAHGIIVPKGTIHRLDAISKSFSGR